ncbi:AAA family ATPase [Nitrospirillum sp. BR 11164]|uniref:AAA family ATPase n=1 Tax=Nitrospirillum sp. BR 11164 TaxID=3104324 RepID=UPI002AFFBD14|nr:AAA family ATPase [Nitrospirillum sp. BR 11164]MEA1647818.1 AAA family ATPase [Nitrospirillum sp. BR 11164]
MPRIPATPATQKLRKPVQASNLREAPPHTSPGTGSGLDGLDRLAERFRRDDHLELPAPATLYRHAPGLERAAIAACIRDAVGATPGLAEALDGGRLALAIAITVPDRSWVRPAVTVAASVLQGISVGRPVSQGLDPDDLDPPDALPNWVALHRNGISPRQDLGPMDEAAADSLGSGTGVVYIAAAGEDLPQAFAEAADFKLSLPPLTWRRLAVAIEECGGRRPGRSLPDALCGVLNALDLRLAARASTVVDTWVERLERVALARIPRVMPEPAYLPGMPEFVKWAEALRRDLRDYREGRIAWHEVAGQGLVLAGPSGTGKTLQLMTLAAKCKVPLVTASHGQWQSAGHQGDMLAAMAQSFEDAATQAPCILFVDELDAFPARRSGGNPRHESYNHQIMNFFLELLDGAHGRPGTIVVGACNFPALLDPALVRPGRMERIIRIGYPDQAALAEILRYHLGAETLAGVDLSSIAAMAAGGSGADCEYAVRGARSRARAEGREMVLADLEAEFRPVETAVQFLDPALRRLCAVHEAGHSVAATLLRPGFLVSASIAPTPTRNGLAGTYYAMAGNEVLGQADMMALIRILLAGRAAEEIVLGTPTSGAGGDEDSDLAKATLLVARMLTCHGLGGQLAWTGQVTAENLPQTLGLNPALAKRVEHILGVQYASVKELIDHHRAAVEAVASHLIAKEAISAAEVVALLRISSNEERTIQ